MFIRVVCPTLLVLIPALIPALVEPEKYLMPKFYILFVFLVVISFLHSYFVQYKSYLRVKYETEEIIVESFFQKILDSIKALKPRFADVSLNQIPYRLNIMKSKFNVNPFKGDANFFKTCLMIRHHYNMKGYLDLNIILHPGRGVSGKAFKENIPKIGDTTLINHPGGDDWNLTSEEKKITEKVKSIISVPIRHVNDKDKVVGVLNVDSTEELKDTPFQVPDFQELLRKMSEVFYNFVA